jgi:hypothetical protein
MRRATTLGLCFTLILVVAPTFAGQSSTQQPKTPAPTPDNWQRMKECADQVARVTKRQGLSPGREGVMGIENHYSPTYERCYVRLNLFNSAVKTNKRVPAVYYELWDAFEERLLAMCTDALVPDKEIFCTIQEEDRGFVGCAVCGAYVKDRMTK